MENIDRLDVDLELFDLPVMVVNEGLVQDPQNLKLVAYLANG